MHGRISPKMYTGSMVGAGAMAFALMPYAIANARPDEDCTVDLNPTVLAAIFGEPIKKVKTALEYLCDKDPDSRSPDCEGRRLVQCGPGPYRYRVVNLEQYRNDALTEDRKEYWKQYRKWERAGRKGKFEFTVNNVNQCEQFNSVQSTGAGAGAGAGAYAEVQTPNGGGDVFKKKNNGGDSTMDTVNFLKSEIGGYFKRNPTAHWSCESEQGICSIARRTDCLAELEEILRWLPNAEKPFRSADSLVKNWTTAIDQAQNAPRPRNII